MSSRQWSASESGPCTGIEYENPDKWGTVKPRTDERGTDAEVQTRDTKTQNCVFLPPHFMRHRRKFVQTFNSVQIPRLHLLLTSTIIGLVTEMAVQTI